MEKANMEVFEAIQKRRSVRDFTGDPVPNDDILKIVDAGRLAASGYNYQPWIFIAVTKKEILDQFKEGANWIEQAGVVIAVVMDTTSEFWIEDGAAAVENMLLAATGLGYGSCWLQGFTQNREATLKRILNVPKEKRLLTLVVIGVPLKWPTKEKKTLDQVLHWQKY
jgi:nitroreductase